MAAITDKFGRPSIVTNYAQSTTVKTQRLAGVSVLEAYDLSKFDSTGPTFFLTYKKTTDPVTGIASITNQRSWKALVNPDNNTLTNLTLAPGYTDGIIDAGDFIEPILTSYWGNELIGGILDHANPDGTLKTSAVNAALGITGTPPADWTSLPVTPTVVSSNGQREHVIRCAGVNYTPTIGAGAKLRIPRTGTTPTTSMNFVAASSQYAQKTSPAGITFTGDFTTEAWVYLNSYTSGAIIGRDSVAASGSGWETNLNVGGQLSSYWRNGSGASAASTRQVVPLKKWTHIACVHSVNASGTITTYIDGVAVPNDFSAVGATTLVQSTDPLTIGKRNSTGSYLDGMVANARVWSTARTAAQVRDNMNQEVPASTTGLVFHAKGNGSWNDSSTNLNHLTAVGGAVNNFASHPYSATEYSIVTNVTYTGGNTDVTVFTGSNCLPNETLGATSYSTARAPYGFPADATKWQLDYQCLNDGSGAGGLTVWAYYNDSRAMYARLSVPTGAWKLSAKCVVFVGTSTPTDVHAIATLCATNGGSGGSTSAVDWSIQDMSGYYQITNAKIGLKPSGFVRPAVQTMYYLNIGTNSVGSVNNLYVLGSSSMTKITAECAYL